MGAYINALKQMQMTIKLPTICLLPPEGQPERSSDRQTNLYKLLAVIKDNPSSVSQGSLNSSFDFSRKINKHIHLISWWPLDIHIQYSVASHKKNLKILSGSCVF